MSRFEVVSPDDNWLQTAEGLREKAYRAGDAGNSTAMRTWSDLLTQGLHGCGSKCGKDAKSCEHCMPLGDRGVRQVEAFQVQCNPHVVYAPAWIRQIKGEK